MFSIVYITDGDETTPAFAVVPGSHRVHVLSEEDELVALEPHPKIGRAVRDCRV